MGQRCYSLHFHMLASPLFHALRRLATTCWLHQRAMTIEYCRGTERPHGAGRAASSGGVGDRIHLFVRKAWGKREPSINIINKQILLGLVSIDASTILAQQGIYSYMLVPNPTSSLNTQAMYDVYRRS